MQSYSASCIANIEPLDGHNNMFLLVMKWFKTIIWFSMWISNQTVTYCGEYFNFASYLHLYQAIFMQWSCLCAYQILRILCVYCGWQDTFQLASCFSIMYIYYVSKTLIKIKYLCYAQNCVAYKHKYTNFLKQCCQKFRAATSKRLRSLKIRFNQCQHLDVTLNSKDRTSCASGFH